MPPVNLRERRKIETTALIREAALRLAHELGVESVTIEAICEASGISQRTFHNYFPFKEAAFVTGPEPLPEEAVERFLTGTGDLMADLIELMAAHAAVLHANRWRAKLLRDIARVHPRLMPLQMAEFMKFDFQIKGVIGERLGLAADHPSCSALAGAVLGANRATIDRWLEDPELYLPDAVRAGLDAMVSLVRQQTPTNSPLGLATRPLG